MKDQGYRNKKLFSRRQIKSDHPILILNGMLMRNQS